MTDNVTKFNDKILYVFLLALAIKLALFAFATTNTPQAKVLVDSYGYLETARTLAHTGIFGRTLADGSVHHEFLRTPGYPLFLAVFHHHLKLPLDGIILLQVLMTLAAALLCAKTASLIDERLVFLTAVILLFDPTITVYSLLILTESLFMLLLSLFLYFFVVYFKTPRMKWLLLAALALAAAVYVRPIAFYLGIVVGCFLALTSWKTNLKRGLIHALVFITIVYGATGLWLVRNHRQGGGFRFASIINVVASSYGLIGSYGKDLDNVSRDLSPGAYFLNVTSRSVLVLFTKPGSFKYFGSESLKNAGKVFGYPFIIFCMIGFLIGLARCRQRTPLFFAGCVALYFIAVSIGGALWREAPRFRVPMMPFIAILSAYGWIDLRERIKAKGESV